MLEFRVLGPLEAINSGPVELGGAKPRTLLAHLLVHVGEVVSTDSLIDAMWGEDPPDSATNSLQSYVSRLRKALGSDRIESRSGGYVLRAETAEVDALRFDELASRGRALVKNSPAEAAALLRDALGLWRGRPYADVGDGLTLGPEVTRLEELRLATVEDRIEADLAMGKHAVLVGELEALVEEHPWRERLWGQLLIALYRSGRQADALRAFQRARRILGEELGIEPSPELRAIEGQILEQSPNLGISAEAAPPRPEAGMSVRGYELRAPIGRGPYGETFRAYHPSVGREVVIETIGPELANEPAFIRDFESTARLLGARRHPNIVPVYDFWREPDAAYFVTGWVDGSRLETLLRDEQLNPVERAAILDQVAAALDAVHRRGLGHGNLDGSKVIIDRTGTAVVVGFGPSRHESGETLDEAVTIDLAALARLAEALLAVEHRPPLQATTTAQDVAAAYRTAAGLDQPDEDAFQVGRNPYKGLRAFEEADARDFHGRGALIARLVARLGEEGPKSRFLAVVGPSGSGKSSVVKAGLMASLRRGAIPGSSSWFRVSMFPGAHPHAELEAALLRIAVNPPASLLDQLEDGPLGILRGINRVLPDDTSDVLLVIDQFEELFTLTGAEERERFLDGLITALEDPRSRLRLVITMRADFYDRPLAHHGLAAWMQDRNEVVVPLSAGELKEAITGPALRVGVAVEPELVARMVGDVTGQPGGLPLLQYALTGLFDHKVGDTMTLGQYEATGGIAGVVAARAEAIYEELTDTERRAAPQVFLRLVTVGESGEATRRRVRSSELMGLGSDRRVVAAVVNAFGSNRLLTFGRDPVSRGPTVEVAHEALLTRWPRLAGWIEAAVEDVRAYSRLAASTHEWVDADRSDDYLITGGRLEAAAAWAAGTDFELSTLERDYLAASVAHRDEAMRRQEEQQAREAALRHRSARRLRGLVAILLVAAVLAGALSIFALSQRNQAQQDAQAASSRAIVGEATGWLDDDPELAIMLALEAAARDPEIRQEAAAILHEALPAHRTLQTLPGRAAYPAPDGSWIVTGDASGAVRTFDADSGELLAELGSHDTSVTAVVVSADGSEVASGDQTGSVRIWDVTTGEQVGGWDDPASQAIEMLRFTPDGRLAAAVSVGPATLRDRAGTVTAELITPEYSPQNERTVDLTGDGTVALTPNGLFDATSGDYTEPSGFEGEFTIHAAITPDGRVKVLASPKHVFREEISSGDTRLWTDLGGELSALTIDDDGTQVAIGTTNGSVVIWGTGFGDTMLRLSGHRNAVSVVEFMEGSDRLLTASLDGTSRVWDVTREGAREVATVDLDPCCATAVALSRDGSTVATLNWDSGIHVSDVETGADLMNEGSTSKEGSLALGRESSILVGADGRRLARSVPDGDALPLSNDRMPGPTFLVALSPDASDAAFASGDAVKVYSLGTEDPPIEFAAEGTIAAIAYSPDGARLLIGDEAGLLLVRPTAPDDRRRISHPQRLTATGVAYALDGERVAATWLEGGASVFAVESGQMIMRRIDARPAVDLGFSADGATLAVLNKDGRLQLLDAETGTLIVTIPAHTDEATDLAVSADGRRLATSAFDGLAKVYTFDEDELFDIARSRLTRDLSPAECREYLEEDCPET